MSEPQKTVSMTCNVCPHGCRLSEGQTGLCRARKNNGGKIVSRNYGILTGIALDPIEKKPLYLFYPGSYILSLGSFGCNLKCSFCQNHEISQADESIKVYLDKRSPEEIADLAIELSHETVKKNIGIAYTYNEPLIGWEYVLDTSVLIRKAGLKNVLVTNGCVNMEILEKLLPYIDAMNVDLKCFHEEGYRELGGDLSAVMSFIEKAAKTPECHVEITSLIVPGLNDKEEDMEKESKWIAELSPDIPLHITRYFPNYRMRTPATELSVLRRLKEIADQDLRYVYLGNV